MNPTEPRAAGVPRGPGIPPWAAGVSDGLWDAGCRDIVYVPESMF